MKFCYNCGKPIVEPGEFCVECGARLSLADVEEGSAAAGRSGERVSAAPYGISGAAGPNRESRSAGSGEAGEAAGLFYRGDSLEPEANQQRAQAETGRNRTQAEASQYRAQPEAGQRRTEPASQYSAQAEDKTGRVYAGSGSGMPPEDDREKPNKKTLYILLGVLLLAVIGLIIFLVLRNRPEEKKDDGNTMVAEYNGNFKVKDESGKVWVETEHIRKVNVLPDEGQQKDDPKNEESTVSEKYVVRVELNDEGRQRLEDATKENIGRNLIIEVNEVIISTTKVTDVITGGTIEIAGGIPEDEAQKILEEIIGETTDTTEAVTDPKEAATDSTEADPSDPQEPVIEGELPITQDQLGMILDVLPHLPKYNDVDPDTKEVTHPGIKNKKDKDGWILGVIFPALSRTADSILVRIRTEGGQGNHCVYDIRNVIAMAEIFTNETVSEKYLSQAAYIMNMDYYDGDAFCSVQNGELDINRDEGDGPSIDVERIVSTKKEIVIYYTYYEAPGASGGLWEAHFSVKDTMPRFSYTKYRGASEKEGGKPEETEPSTKTDNTTENGKTTEAEKTTENDPTASWEVLKSDLEANMDLLEETLSFISKEGGDHYWNTGKKQDGYSDQDLIGSVIGALKWDNRRLREGTKKSGGHTYYTFSQEKVCRMINLLVKEDISAEALPAAVKQYDDHIIDMYSAYGSDWYVRTEVESGMVLSPEDAGEPLSSKVQAFSYENDEILVQFYIYGAGDGESYWTAHFRSDGKGGVYLDSIEPK